MDALRELWTAAGLEAVDARDHGATHVRRVRRVLVDEHGTTGTMGQLLGRMTQADAERLKDRVRASLAADPRAASTCGARADAIKGRVPTRA